MAEKVVHAILKNIRISSQKLNLVASAIRGMPVSQALTYLRFCPKRAARDVFKALTSVIANAENNLGFDASDLRVSEAFVNNGSCLGRTRPRAKGRAGRIRKQFSHLKISVEKKD
jgi:large subunit ribosomal protein L22